MTEFQQEPHLFFASQVHHSFDSHSTFSIGRWSDECMEV